MAVAGTENMRRSQLILVLLIIYFICGMQCNDSNDLAAGGGGRLSRRGVGGGHGYGNGNGNGNGIDGNSGSSNSGSGSGAEVPVLGAAAAAAAGHHGSRGHSAASRHGYHLRAMLTTTAFSAAILV